ncbi:MAG: DUF2628 domain-containing protein [Oscillospiraceae bacterium]|jgi:ribosomal protein L40E|nr:DUF2628 domain-containing protein [Oscillospiraceae bacterium]
MVSFDGVLCVGCKTKFKNSDDIVVCPECGTPYHRECYNKIGYCVFEDKHKDNFKWKNLLVSENSESKEIICASCAHKNPHNATYCENCKSRLVEQRSESGSSEKNSSREVFGGSGSTSFVKVSLGAEPLLGFNPEEEISGIEAKDIVKYVQNNPNYYLNAFKLMEKKRKGRFNFSAFLFSGVWFLYRKQYKIGAIISVISLAITTIALCVNNFYSETIYNKVIKSFNLPSDSVVPFEKIPEFQEKLFSLPISNVFLFFLPNLLMIVDFLIMVVCGFKGNKFYMEDCFTKIGKIKKETELRDDLDQKFLMNGGVNYHVIWCFALVMLLLRLIPFM